MKILPLQRKITGVTDGVKYREYFFEHSYTELETFQ